MGPWRTITRALTQNQYELPMIVRVAGRGIVHDAAPGLGEQFPLRVRPGYQLRYDAANSLPNTPVVISGPAAGTGLAAVEFISLNGTENYTGYGSGFPEGIDGTGGPPRGFEIRGGDLNLVVHAGTGTSTLQSTVILRIDSVAFTGEVVPPGSVAAQSVNCLNIQAAGEVVGSLGGRVTMTVANCSFSTQYPLTGCPNVTGYTNPGLWNPS
ncbi:MAG: hypothetical protein L0323_19385, partial [Planctomycetes bacterium]|nr:hypothetical protein [Planctomycetota bacterium]